MSNGGIQGHFHTFGLYPYFAEVSILYSLSMHILISFLMMFPFNVKASFFFKYLDRNSSPRPLHRKSRHLFLANSADNDNNDEQN